METEKNLSFKFLIVVFGFSFLLLSFNSYAATNFAGQQKKKIEIEKAKKTLRVGEKLFYDVLWNGLYIGEGTLEVKEIVNLNGREAYHIIATAKSNEFLSTFYKVEDVIHTYIDVKNLYSLRFEKTQMEGKHKADEVTVFDQDGHTGHYESLLGKTKKDFPIPPNVQDLASVFYYFRTLDVKPDSKVTIEVNADEKNWKSDMNILDTQYLEIVHKGSYKVFCVQPRAPFKGVISKRGKVWMYITTDEKRVPVLIKIRIPFGIVTGVLQKAE